MTLHVVIDPPIWRRIAVDGNSNLRMLHHVIQVAFAWTDGKHGISTVWTG
jgi:hypothetical protein